MRTWRLCPLAVLLALAALSTPAPAASQPQAAGEDSPPARSGSLQARVRGLRREVGELERAMELMIGTARRYADWETCITWVPVSEFGDGNASFGFSYDHGDGTGIGFQTALATDRRRRGRSQYVFLNFSTRRTCRSAEPQEGGTADPAKVVSAGSRRPSRRSVRRLETRVRRLKRQSRVVERASERFDAWESCVSWVPVTQNGDEDGRFGYLFGERGSTVFSYRAAITVDRSPADDPDYWFLALVGSDRPGGKCRDEPGESPDRVVPARVEKRAARSRGGLADRVEGIEQDVDSLTEDIDDLREPIGEFDLFDECMYLIGATEHGKRDGSSGYVYGTRRRPALALDLRAPGRPRYAFMAFPGEEPPSIECNEDARQDTSNRAVPGP
jgi:hypothetical protein